MSLVLQSSGGGSVTIAEPTTASNFTQTLPAADGTVAILDGSNNLSVAGNLSFNSGYGSSAVAYGCRAWVNFNGEGVVAIRSSGNVSSITDNGTGNYTVNFTTAITDANYSTTISYSQNYGTERCVGAQINQGASGNEQAPTTTSFRFVTTGAISEYDSKYVCVAIFR
jgi:uncharacterized protein (AIM24 family)